jgi:hypothetical protein
MSQLAVFLRLVPRVSQTRIAAIACLSLWIVVALLLIQFVRYASVGAVSRTHSFIVYYTLARLVAERTDLTPSYTDDAWFQSQLNRFQPGIVDVNWNPPTTALLLLPLSDLDYQQARVGWIVLSLLALISAGSLLLWTLRLSGWYVPALIAFSLVYEPLLANFHLGQVYVVMLGLLIVAWVAYHRRRENLLGIFIGLLFAFKLAGLVLWILLFIQARWRAFAAAVMTVLLLVLGSLPWLGFSAWRAFLPRIIGESSQAGTAITAYQDLPGFFRHLLTFDVQLNPTPLMALPVASTGFIWLSFIVMLAISAYWARRQVGLREDLLFGAFVILSLVLSPFSLDYHYALVLVPIAILVAELKQRGTLGLWLLFALALFLIAADLPYRSPRVAVGALAFLAYPKLCGACLLWGLSLWLLRRPCVAKESAKLLNADAPQLA